MPRTLTSAVAAALLTAVIACPAPAQEPPQPPAPDDDRRAADVEAALRQRRADAIAGKGSPEPRPGFGPGPFDQREPSEAEFRAAEDAMRKHAPNWWRRFDNTLAGAPLRRRMTRAVVERHRELQRIQQRDPEQYAREIKQVELEDEIVGLAPRVWRERDSTASDVEEMKSKLRRMVADLVDLRIQNREARLQRLSETLAAEKRRLEADKRDRDKTVDQRYEAVLNRRLEPVFPAGPGNPGRPGGRGLRGGPDGPAVLGPPPEQGPRDRGPDLGRGVEPRERNDREPQPPPPPGRPQE